MMERLLLLASALYVKWSFILIWQMECNASWHKGLERKCKPFAETSTMQIVNDLVLPKAYLHALDSQRYIVIDRKL